MSHFFVSTENVGQEKITISGQDVNHIKNVLRKKVGDTLTVSDGTGFIYECSIGDLQPDIISLDIISKNTSNAELPVKIVLFQGLPKSDKLELIVQKAVELGVSEIVPVAMKNCVMKIVPQKAAQKTKRLQAIAESAAKQSGRAIIPTVTEPMSFTEALRYGEGLDVKFLPYENERGMDNTRALMASCRGKRTVGIWIGPEGGYDPKEVAAAGENGWERISLGNRILRTETAGLAALSMLVLTLED